MLSRWMMKVRDGEKMDGVREIDGEGWMVTTRRMVRMRWTLRRRVVGGDGR